MEPKDLPHPRFRVLLVVLLALDAGVSVITWLASSTDYGGTLAEFVHAEIASYSLHTSLFDVVMLSVGRVMLLAAMYSWVFFSQAAVRSSDDESLLLNASQSSDHIDDIELRDRRGARLVAQGLALVVCIASFIFDAVKLSMIVNTYVLLGTRSTGLALVSVAMVLPLFESIWVLVGFRHVERSVKCARLGIDYTRVRQEAKESEDRAAALEDSGEDEDDDIMDASKDEGKSDEEKARRVRIRTRRLRKQASIGRLASLARPELKLIIVGTVFMLLSSLANLATPAFFGHVIDAVTRSKSDSELKKSIVILVLIFVGGSISTALRAYVFTLAGQRVVARLRQNLFSAIVLQDISFFDKNRVGELTNRLASDTAVLQNAVTVNFSMLARYAVQIVGTLAIMFYLSWSLTLVILSVVPVVAIGAVIYGRMLKRLQKAFQDTLGKAASTAEEALGSIRTVRSFAKEDASIEKYSEQIETSYHIGARVALATGGFSGVIGLIAQCAIALVLWFGAEQVLNGKISPGVLTSFLLYTLTMAMAFGVLSSLYGDFMSAVGASVRIFNLLDRTPQIITGHNKIDSLEGKVTFEDVSFTYPSRKDTPVLKNVSFNVEVGSVVALVGASGGGKSTLMALIQRFYDPDEGSIAIDGQCIRTLDSTWLRTTAIAMVSQEPVLFSSTIAENIAFGRLTATDEEIEAAARQANAHDFIMGFQDGYKTNVGERGVKLSGGQKQRIAIARALLLSPRILLLDEATSALDAESEHVVADAINRAMVGRTVLIIAHRLSTVRDADKVIVIGGGRIVEQGTHDELLAADGAYKKLVKRQMMGGGHDDDDEDDSSGAFTLDTAGE